MKKHFKFLAFAYLGAIALVLLLEVSQFDKVDRLRTQIEQSYELISGRDEGIRLELEYRRFRAKLGAFMHSDDMTPEEREERGVSMATVQTWFDILWSRVYAINRDDILNANINSHEFESMLRGMRKALKEIDPILQVITPNDHDKYGEIVGKLAKYDTQITSVATSIAQARLEEAATLQEHLNWVLESMDALLITSGAGGLLIVTLFGVEAYRARKEERKTKSREARVRFLAEHDTLTGLGNRAYLNDKMAQYIREADAKGSQFYLLLLDLDKFKDVNDTFGHPMGDRLLKKAAARLVGVFSATDDVLVRLGGDEFAVLTRRDSRWISNVAERAISALSSVFELSGNEIRISTSIGISCYPKLSRSADDLMRDADLALYEAKNKGRHTYCMFEIAMGIAIKHRMKLEADLRSALKKGGGGLEVYYQPQVTLDHKQGNREIVGVEALVRWFHPTDGQIPTMDFIEIAEISGLIDELSDWIVHQACLDVVSWHKAGFMLNLSVNLSPYQLNNPHLPDELFAHLDECGFDPRYLTLEITESAGVTDKDSAAEMLGRLAARGISLAMDDFGTGYSNLGYLNSLPLHTLKIDRTFISHITGREQERKLVRGVINLARGMGLKIVAEGVETEEQVAFLQEENCDIGQGYLFGRPVHKLGMLALLNDQYEQQRQGELRLEA